MAKDAADYEQMYEPLRQLDGATRETGLGHYASSKLDGDAAEITTLKGTVTLTIELKGSGLGAADLDKMRDRTRKLLPKVP